MGHCCCKGMARNNAEEYSPAQPSTIRMQAPEPRVPVPKSVIVDHLILQMLTLIYTFVDNFEDSPVCLVELHAIAGTDDGWIQVVTSLVDVVPLEDPFGPSAITILLDDCPLPSKELVVRLIHEIFEVSFERASNPHLNVAQERNLCVVLGSIAEKMAGPNSILSEKILDYLHTVLERRADPHVVLFALIALEKFAHTTENKLRIKCRLERAGNPLLELERLATSGDHWWRQVGFCAKWALDNDFVVDGRPLSYEMVDMSKVNVILNNKDVSEYLKISADGLEARCDSYSFESVRCTFPVNEDAWYYEAIVVSPGVMQIGWATKNSHFLNHEGYGIGDDLYSVSYDGCRRLVWYNAEPRHAGDAEPWAPGDVLGCLLDLGRREAAFYLNGEPVYTCTEIFNTTKQGFFAAASFMAFQQCRFNFGSAPFQYAPARPFKSFNDFGVLDDEDKKVLPRRMLLEHLSSIKFTEDSCTLCCDEKSCCVLEPCGHRGFCSPCTAQLRECPLCRARIDAVRCDP